MTLADDFVAGTLDTHMALQGTPGVEWKNNIHTDTVTLTAICGEVSSDDDLGDMGLERHATRTVRISRNPAASYGGVADPQEGAIIRIPGANGNMETWIFNRVISKNAYRITVSAVQDAAITHTQPNHQR